MECCVSGCDSRLGVLSSKIVFYKLPPNKEIPKKAKKRQLLRGIKRNKVHLKKAQVYSKHFSSGQSNRATSKPDTEADDSISKIIINTPEITEEFDVPEYVTLDNERTIELDLIHKYITNPVCDENGYYINDHDYLGLPIIRKKTERRQNHSSYEHNYSIQDNPACLYCDLRHFCNICQCSNLNLFTFNTHMMVHTIRNDVMCKHCGQKFLTTSCLNNHISTHKTVCDICGTEVPIVQLFAHQHANILQKREIHARGWYQIKEKDKVHFCIFCMKSFGKNYFKHLATHKIPIVKTKEKMRGRSTGKRLKGNKLIIVKKFVPIERKL